MHFRQHPVRRRFNADIQGAPCGQIWMQIDQHAPFHCLRSAWRRRIRHAGCRCPVAEGGPSCRRGARRGTPVMLRGGDRAGDRCGGNRRRHGLAELSAAGESAPVLLLAPSRAAAVAPARRCGRSAAWRKRRWRCACRPACWTRPCSAASPTPPPSALPEGSRAERLPAPPLAAAALALAKLARLLPAVLAAPHAARARDALPGRTCSIVDGGRGAGLSRRRPRPRSAGWPRRRCRWRARRMPASSPSARRMAASSTWRSWSVSRRRDGQGRRAAGAAAFRMLHRRPARQPALRLRPAAARRHPAHGARRAPGCCSTWRRKAVASAW